MTRPVCRHRSKALDLVEAVHCRAGVGEGRVWPARQVAPCSGARTDANGQTGRGKPGKRRCKGIVFLQKKKKKHLVLEEIFRQACYLTKEEIVVYVTG